MTVPWGPLLCLAGAGVVALLFKRYAPPDAQKMSSPVWWMFLIISTVVFGGLALSLLPSQG